MLTSTFGGSHWVSSTLAPCLRTQEGLQNGYLKGSKKAHKIPASPTPVKELENFSPEGRDGIFLSYSIYS